uniref:Uncharacterized protein n=1 Tax=Sphaerodactylus townsendi TaxID=933632 RepID=A0ACB8EE10_9SAUR
MRTKNDSGLRILQREEENLSCWRGTRDFLVPYPVSVFSFGVEENLPSAREEGMTSPAYSQLPGRPESLSQLAFGGLTGDLKPHCRGSPENSNGYSGLALTTIGLVC